MFNPKIILLKHGYNLINVGSIIMEHAVINALFLLQKGEDGALGLKKRVLSRFGRFSLQIVL